MTKNEWTGFTGFMRACLRLCAVVLAALPAAGCADLHWHRDGADAAALDRDLEECRRLARLEARRHAWPFGLTASRMIVVDARGLPVAVHPYHFQSDQFQVENDLARYCMRSRGYELVPAKKQ